MMMDREERLRRRREQFHARWNRETAEERKLKLEARRACERCQCTLVSTEQWQMLLQQGRKARHRSDCTFIQLRLTDI